MPFRLALNVEARSRPSRTSCVSRTLGVNGSTASDDEADGCRRGVSPRDTAATASAAAPTAACDRRFAGRRERPADGRGRVRARMQRARIDMPSHVGGERAGRRVAALRLRPQRGEHDVVERSRQPLSQSPRLGALQVHALVVDRRLRAEVAHHRVRWRLRRLLEAASLGDAPRRIAAPVRMPAREQLVEHHAERVHVARRGRRLAAQLLGARVLRRQDARDRPTRRRRRSRVRACRRG